LALEGVPSDVGGVGSSPKSAPRDSNSEPRDSESPAGEQGSDDALPVRRDPPASRARALARRNAISAWRASLCSVSTANTLRRGVCQTMSGLFGSTDFHSADPPGGVPREQKILKGHLPRVIYHHVYYSSIRRKMDGWSPRGDVATKSFPRQKCLDCATPVPPPPPPASGPLNHPVQAKPSNIFQLHTPNVHYCRPNFTRCRDSVCRCPLER